MATESHQPEDVPVAADAALEADLADDSDDDLESLVASQQSILEGVITCW